MSISIRVADERDWDSIATLNHDVFCLELGQYQAESSGRKVDRFNETNIYIVANDGDELVGMLSITRYSKAPFSTLNRVPELSDDVRVNLPVTAEIRLLAIKESHRRIGIYNGLVQTALDYCDQNGIKRVLISAIDNRLSLYEFMGFKTIAPPVSNGNCLYHPMLLTRMAFEQSGFRQKLFS